VTERDASARDVSRDETLRRHAYHRLRVAEVVPETDDARSFVLDVPADLQETFRYRAGQFCSFRIHVDGDEHARCYSMSSAPETDAALTVTVKRVPGGVVSNWLIDHVAPGDELEVNPPSGTFCVAASDGDRPIVAFCGGSGVTPVMSIAKSALAGTARPIRMLYANRGPESVIFDDALRSLQAQHGARLRVQHHHDSVGGFLDGAAISSFVDGDLDADVYICGPQPFMDLVEATLVDLGVDRASIFIERFVTPQPGVTPQPAIEPAAAPGPTTDEEWPEQLVLILRGKKHEVPYHGGDTVLETARRANLPAPYSCEAGNCATCMALVHDGSVRMRVNDALTDDEVDEGWVLTCQSIPTSPSLTIEYESL
jgi:ferredoxin-NADP reductase